MIKYSCKEDHRLVGGPWPSLLFSILDFLACWCLCNLLVTCEKKTDFYQNHYLCAISDSLNSNLCLYVCLCFSLVGEGIVECLNHGYP